MTLTTAPAAGWYHDPADAGGWRWWDGSTWTDHVRPMTEAQVVTAPVVAIEPVPTHAPAFEHIASVPSTPAPVAASSPAPVPVAPAPAPAPAPVPVQVPATVIPQPGQVAAGAAVSGGSVRMTPETPVSDQLYWHSAAAEMIEVPRLNHPSRDTSLRSGSITRAPSYVRDWNDLGSAHTAGIWLLAALPLIGTGVSIAVQLATSMAGLTGIVPRLIGSAAVLLLAWIFAGLDARALADRGYHPPRLAWMLLLPPLFYFISRGRAVRRESKRAWPPELFFVANIAILVALSFAAAAYLVAMGVVVIPTIS